MMGEQLPFPARIHVLLARDAPFGVVIRRGPSKLVCTLGWKLENDTFTMGQWLKGRIYGMRSDLSPDGQHLLYFAADFGDDLRSWTAISHAPYLKATGFWPKGDAWHGGGLWLDKATFWINDGYRGGYPTQPKRRPPRLSQSATYPNFVNHGGEDPGVYFLRLQRDGWWMLEHKSSEQREVFRFEKRHDSGWTLCKIFNATFTRRIGRGVYYDQHQLVHRKTGEIIDVCDWEWADIERRRVVWAQGGQLWVARLNNDGLFEQKMLRDFNAMTFEPIAAPY